MLLSLLTIGLGGLTLLSLALNKGNPIAPAVLFVGGFFFSVFWTICYAARWGYSMHANTFAAVTIGCTVFSGACLLIRLIPFRGVTWKKARSSFLVDTSKSTATVLISFALIQMIVFLWFLVRVRQMFPATSLSESIASYKYAGTFTTTSTYLGFPLNPMRVFCINAAYVTGYVFCQQMVTRSWRSIITLFSGFSTLLNCCIQLESGGRTGFAIYCVYIATVYLLLLRNERRGSLRITRRMAIIGIAAFVLFILGFRLLAIGRHSTFSLVDGLSNVSVYCGSEIPNLDHWMQLETRPVNNTWGSMTFITSIKYLGPKLHIDAWTYTLDLPFLTSHGNWMGNVYSTFYAFLYDFGWVGLVILTAAMAAISELLFCLSGRARHCRDIWIILYGLCAPQLLLSFFSNKFYESFLAIPVWRTLFAIFVMRFLIRTDWRAILERKRRRWTSRNDKTIEDGEQNG